MLLAGKVGCAKISKGAEPTSEIGVKSLMASLACIRGHERVRDMPRDDQHKRLPVSRRACQLNRSDSAIRAAAVLDHDGMAPGLFQLTCHVAGNEVRGSASGKADQQPDRPAREILRRGPSAYRSE